MPKTVYINIIPVTTPGQGTSPQGEALSSIPLQYVVPPIGVRSMYLGGLRESRASPAENQKKG